MKGTAARKFSRANVIFFGSLLALLIVTVYCAWYANYYLSGNADDIVYPYFFQHFHFHDIILPGQHSNILKFPLYILQAIFPYTFTTFSVVNIGLVVITILGWAGLLVWLLGRRYAPHICLVLISILLGSQLFNYDILGTTIRNIEFPITLGFVVFTGSLLSLHKRGMARSRLILGGVLGLLYSLTLAGDSFFIYTVSLSLFVCLACYWFWFSTRKGVISKLQIYGLKMAAVYALGFTVLSFVIREAISFLGIARYYNASVFLPHVLPLNHLGPSVGTALVQLMNLTDANIFGQKIRPGNGLVFMNFALLLLGLVGLIFILKDFLTTDAQAKLTKVYRPARAFTLGVTSLAFFVTFIMYIMSDQVVTETASGVVTSSFQERYLTLMPLVLVIGIVYLLRRNLDTIKFIYYLLPSLAVLILLASIPNIKNSHVYQGQFRQSEISVANTLKANHITEILSGYWYGSTTRFWSHDQVQFASVAACNHPEPTFNNRFSWYKPSTSIKSSALVIVHQGPDSIFWQCPDSTLLNIYGPPVKVIHVNTGDRPEIWLYNYDVRSKLTKMIF